MDFNSYRMRQRPVYMVFEGVVTHLEIAPGMMGRYDGCTQMVTVENEAGNTVNFLMNAWEYPKVCVNLQTDVR